MVSALEAGREPKVSAFLSDQAREHFNKMVNQGRIEIIDPTLVRLPNGYIDFCRHYHVEEDAQSGQFDLIWNAPGSPELHATELANRRRYI